MNQEEYKSIKQVWDEIDHIEKLEEFQNNSHTNIQFVAEIRPITVPEYGTVAAMPFPLPANTNRIIMEALTAYKNDLKNRMAHLTINDTMAVNPIDPIDDSQPVPNEPANTEENAD